MQLHTRFFRFLISIFMAHSNAQCSAKFLPNIFTSNSHVLHRFLHKFYRNFIRISSNWTYTNCIIIFIKRPMNTTITREELYENFVTKEFLHEEFKRFALEMRSLILEISNMLNGKINNLEVRLDEHMTQNALEHNDLRRGMNTF